MRNVQGQVGTMKGDEVECPTCDGTISSMRASDFLPSANFKSIFLPRMYDNRVGQSVGQSFECPTCQGTLEI